MASCDFKVVVAHEDENKSTVMYFKYSCGGSAPILVGVDTSYEKCSVEVVKIMTPVATPARGEVSIETPPPVKRKTFRERSREYRETKRRILYDSEDEDSTEFCLSD